MQIIDRAGAILAGKKVPDAERLEFVAELDRQAGELMKRGNTDIGRQLGALSARVTGDLSSEQDARTKASQLLHVAAGLRRIGNPALSRYESLKRVVMELHSRHPAQKRFAVIPETVIQPPADAPAAPARDPAYDHLSGTDRDFAYWNDPVFQKLAGLTPEQIPDGALFALCTLSRSRASLKGFEDFPQLHVTQVYLKLGARLHPAIMAYLASGREDAAIKPFSDEWTASYFCDAAKKWPEPRRTAFFRLLLEHGWKKSVGSLPDEDWAKTLRAAFADSPYGPLER